MSKDDTIARRYARGLAEEARESNSLEAVRGDLRILSHMLDDNAVDRAPEFGKFLESPVVPPAEKIASAGRALTKAGVGKTVTDFLSILVERNRTRLVPRIYRAFLEISGEMTGEIAAVVRTARPLSEEQNRRLAEALAAAVGSKVRIHEQVEPGLLAGARVTVGDRTFDGTVLGKLEGLQGKLMRG